MLFSSKPHRSKLVPRRPRNRSGIDDRYDRSSSALAFQTVPRDLQKGCRTVLVFSPKFDDVGGSMSAARLICRLTSIGLGALACTGGAGAGGIGPVPVNCDDEAACIALSKGSVARVQGVLQIKPGAGDAVAFRNAPPDCQENLDPEDGDPVFCPQYRLTQYLPGRELWIIDGSGEGSIVVSGATGEKLVEKSGSASFSPAGTWVSLFESEGEAQQYSVDIRATSTSDLRSDFVYRSEMEETSGFTEMTAQFIGWKDDDRLELSVNVRDENSETTAKPAFVVHSGTSWKLERSWEK
jgi:hypothetical protein